MKNKQVKQMMRDVIGGRWLVVGGNGRFIKNFGLRFSKFKYETPFGVRVSIKASELSKCKK